MNNEREKELLRLFDIGLWLKAAGGAVELGAAFAIAFAPRVLVERIATLATGGELGQDPDDPIASTIREFAHSYAIHTHYVLASYLAFDGILKIVLVALVFKGYRFAFPLFMAGIGILGAYTVYRAIVTDHSFLFALVALDAALILLAAHENKRRNALRAA